MVRKQVLGLFFMLLLFFGITAPSAWALFPMSMELNMGNDAAAQIEASYPSAVDERVTRIGNELARYSIRNGIEYKFLVLNGMGQENAFALPGGHVYITRELLDFIGNDDDALAFVLGHEIGHCDARHAMEKMEAGFIVSLIFGAVMKGSDYAGLVSNIVGLSFLHYSRDNEFEADNFGLRFCYRAGYNPTKGLKIFKHFAELAGSGSNCDYFSTHPNPDSRIENAIALMNGIDQAGGVTAYDLAKGNYDYISVSGTWNSPALGKIMLTQDDEDVYGLCEDKLWKFKGEIKNKGLEVEWEDLQNEDNKGTAVLDLSPDGKVLSGKWYTGDDNQVSQDVTVSDRSPYDGPNIKANRYAATEFKDIDLQVAGYYFMNKADDTYYNITDKKEGSHKYTQNQLEICRNNSDILKNAEFEENWGYEPGAFAGLKKYSFDLPPDVIAYADRSIKCFELASLQSPHDTDLLMNVGIAKVWKEDVDAGIVCFDQIIKLDEKNVKAYINAGDCYLWKGNEAKAVEYYKSASTIDAKSCVPCNRLGVYYYKHNQYDLALQQFQAATVANVKDYPDYANAALCYYKKGDLDKARRQIEFASAFNEEYMPLYYYQGMFFLEQGDTASAENCFLAGTQGETKHAGCYYELGKLYMKENKPGEARTYFDRYQYFFQGGSHNGEVAGYIASLNKQLGDTTDVALSPGDIKTTMTVPENNQGNNNTVSSPTGQYGSSLVNQSFAPGQQNTNDTQQTVSMSDNITQEKHDILITPGVGVNIVVELTDCIEDFKATLGEPDGVRPVEGGNVYYLYNKSHGLSVICRDKHIQMITILSPTYKTKENICVGTDAEKVMAAYGDKYGYEEITGGMVPGIVEKRENLSYKLNYDGVSFVFNKENKLSVIIFTPPKGK